MWKIQGKIKWKLLFGVYVFSFGSLGFRSGLRFIGLLALGLGYRVWGLRLRAEDSIKTTVLGLGFEV